MQLVDYVWPAMMDALGKEPDADVQGTMMESICEIVELVGHGGSIEEHRCHVHTHTHIHTHTHTHTHTHICGVLVIKQGSTTESIT
jgi:hypothetical protein